MEYKSLKKIYLSLVSNISTLFKNNEFVGYLKTNDGLDDVFLEQISIVNFLEKKLSDHSLIEKYLKDRQKRKTKKIQEDESLIELKNLNNASSFLEEFKKIKFGISNFKDENFKNISEINDSINYLNVFLKNTFNKSLEYFLKPSENSDTSNKDDSKQKETVTAQKIEQNQNNNVNNGNYQNQTGFMNNGFGQINSEAMKENYLYSVASQRLNQDIISGTFYKFKTKPKAIVIIKKVLGSLFILAVLVTLCCIIPGWIGSDLKYPDPENTSVNVYPLSQYNIYNTLMDIFFLLTFSYLGYTLLKNEKNENKKYDFPKMITIFISIILIMLLFSTFIYIIGLFDSIKYIEANSDHYGNSLSSINAAKATLYSNIILDVVYVGIIVVAILGYVFAPKPDIERINLKIKDYMDQMRREL